MGFAFEVIVVFSPLWKQKFFHDSLGSLRSCLSASGVVRPFDLPPGFGAGTPVLDRVELTVFWHDTAEHERTYSLEGFRRGVLAPPDVERAKAGVTP